MKRSSSRVRVLAAVATISCGLFACGNPAYRAAERGDQARLKSEILAKHDRGKLSNSAAACLAQAVATRELTTAKSEAETVTRIKEARACALELDDALEDLMKKHDAAGAEAALSRIDDGKLSNGKARDFLTDGEVAQSFGGSTPPQLRRRHIAARGIATSSVTGSAISSAGFCCVTWRRSAASCVR